ncbi:MAG: isoleucine--tRNA ligase [bacterium]|nr:isoleucine--tRNA ligase [bacterium]
MFQPVIANPDFPAQERERLKWWEENGVLAKYLHRNDSSTKKFSFLDGPITANNPMGVHHAWGRTLKDLYQRFWNMQGYKERFQNGFDNQGLWVEVEVEKKLGFKTKKDIEAYGIDKFVEACKEHTQHFAQIQIQQSQRLGYFMDWGHDYYTMSEENNYAIWHFLKVCWERGWLYKGRDSVPWCPRCGTAISQHEILTEEYQELTHESVYLKFPIAGRDKEYLLVWTTTPWTIPANVAVAVHPDLEYAAWKCPGGETLWALASPPAGLVSQLSDARCQLGRKVRGEKLVGWEYKGPFDDLPRVKKSSQENPATWHTVVAAADLVTAEEGTGLVHIAPGAGTEDFRLGKEAKLATLAVIDESANYLDGLNQFTGQNAKDHPEVIFKALKEISDGQFLFAIQNYTHRYPVCWRCNTELVWRVVDEWYIGMDHGQDSLRQRLLKLPDQIRWVPEFGRERELDWLQHMEDWLISKKRYWGLTLPIWECSCGHFEVVGSLEELKERAVEGWEKFAGHTPHRPWVDDVKIKCPQCGKLASRILDVGNPWLDAGIVAYSTLKYFSDRQYWQEWFPVDLVLESFPGQFKNWFYSLLAMSAVLENRSPFKTLYGHENVVDEKGEEMHKSKGNAIWFDDAAEKIGVDVMRWLYATQSPVLKLRFGYRMADEVRRRFFLILWNCYKFFVESASSSNWTPEKGDLAKPTVLDRWLLSRLASLVEKATSHLADYSHPEAAKAIEDFVIGDLSTWYIRRSRERVGPGATDETDKRMALSVMYKALTTIAKLLAIFTPFVAEEIYQNLVGKDSVHLADWPEVEKGLIDLKLEEKMLAVRELAEEIHALRKVANLKVRQPLARYYSFSDDKKKFLADEEELLAILRAEVNVEEILFVKPKDVSKDFVVGENGALETKISEELKAKGQAREMMRSIQQLRKENGLAREVKVKVIYPKTEENCQVVQLFGKEICQKTLAESLDPGDHFEIIKI